METISRILITNEAVVYFAYGLVFFTMGVAIALQSRRHSRLAMASHLRWLAAFGLVHAFNEWGHIFIPIQATYLPTDTVMVLQALRSLSLAVSYYLLLQFGILVAFSRSGSRAWQYVFPPAMLSAWLALTLILGLPFFESQVTELRAPELGGKELARGMLGFTGAALAGFGMLRQAQSVTGLGSRRIVRYFRWTALCLGLYAIVAGLITPTTGSLVAHWFSIPFGRDIAAVVFVPGLRSLAGLGIALGTIRGLTIFKIETDRLIEEAERSRLRAAERARVALDAIAGTMSQRLPIGTLSDVALEKVLEIMRGSTGWAMLVRPEDGALEVRASRGLDERIASGMLCSATQDCACRRLVDGVEAGPAHISNCALCSERGLSGVFVSVPLQARERVVGILNLANRDYGIEDIGLLASIGRQIGVAMENARLWDELQRKEEARAHLLGRVIAAQEAERKRVARELHDETGQSLSAVIMGVGAAAEALPRDTVKAKEILGDVREIAVHTLEGIRQIILGLRPALLDDLGLAPALRRTAEDLAKRSSVHIEVMANGVDGRLPPEVETVLFRILQEGMNNAARHSKARRAVLQLARSESEVRAVLEDDGIGFDPVIVTANVENGCGLGLLGMRERALLLGGVVIIDSSPGRGTRLKVRLPLLPRKEERN